MKNKQITIPNPCPMNWDNMTPNTNGKYCGSCNKTVLDFTTWEVEEIISYLKTKNERVCGHFNSLQVAVKKPKHHQYLIELYFKTDRKLKIPILKKIALAFIILSMLTLGCEIPVSRTTGEIAVPTGVEDSTCSLPEQTVTGDTSVVHSADLIRDTTIIKDSLKK
jgi:hypothetical protein